MMKIKQISIDELNISTIEACKYYILDFADESMNDILIDFSAETGISSKGYDELSKGFNNAWEFVSNVGKRTTGILELYMLAFKLAMHQLKEEVKDDE